MQSFAMSRNEVEQLALDEALSQAAHEGRDADIQKLIDDGASVESRGEDIFGFTPLIRAAKNDNVQMIKLLLSHGAAVGGRCKSGWAPAHWAASYGKLDALKALVEGGADVSKRTSEGWTPQACAEMKRKPEVVDYLKTLPAAPPKTTPEKPPSSRTAAAAAGTAAAAAGSNRSGSAPRSLGFGAAVRK